jgi:S-formylglutathione hydrolase
MWDYVAEELPKLVFDNFALDQERQAITGHSMGGHGALTLAMGLKNRYQSVSAFSPICNPTGADWGKKQFSAYLGDDEELWQRHDASVMMRKVGFEGPVLVDTGTNDQFIDLLRPEKLAEAINARRQQSFIRLQHGYDHSYFFVSTFMEDHMTFHAEALYDK